MADSKHTPGPWGLERNGFDTDGIRVASDGGRGPTIAWVGADTIGEDNREHLSAEGHADACLVAAAPDLLEACRGAVDLSRRCDLQIDAVLGVPEVRALLAAIAKAEGRS